MKKCDCKGYKSCLCNKELTIFKDLTMNKYIIINTKDIELQIRS